MDKMVEKTKETTTTTITTTKSQTAQKSLSYYTQRIEELQVNTRFELF